MLDANILDLINTCFDTGMRDVRNYSPLTFAYIGDGVFDLIIRTLVVENANRSAGALHKLTTRFVNANAQAEMITAIKDELTEDEAQVFRRGKNAKTGSSAKNASKADYHKATGFEALIGYLYITGQHERMMVLIRHGMEHVCGVIPTGK